MAQGGKIFSFAKDYTRALVLLTISLIVLWAVLNWLHTKFSGNVVGNFAGTVGGLASGSKYNF